MTMTLRRREVFPLLAASALPARARAAPRPGGTATLVANGEPTTLVPLLDSNTRTRAISTKVLEGLVKFDAAWTPQPVLATAWSLSQDGLRLTFNLRPGVKWHDGKDFTSADVRFSLLAFRKAGPRARITFAAIIDVETPDPLTAVVVLARPVPYLLKALTGGETPILPAHAYASDNYTDSPNGNAPIGTGPFVFKEWRRGSYVVLERNPNYWRTDLPYLDRFVVRFVGDAAMVSTQLETGEADVSFDVSLYDLDRLKRNPKLAVEIQYDAYLNNALILEYNLDTPVLAKPEVRHAIAHAIDRRFIIDSIYLGTAGAAGSTIPRVFKSYNDEAPFAYPFDLDRAAKLLDAAGYPKGPDGIRFSLRLAYMPSDPFRRTTEFLRGSLAKLGIKAEIVPGDLASYIRRVYTERGFDINLNGISRLFDPTAGVQRLYWSDGIRNVAPYVNAAHYNNPAVDDLFRAAAVERDEDRRAAAFHEIQAIVGKDLPAIAVIELPTVIVRNTRLNGLVTTIDAPYGDLATAFVS
jgi:peptide/nickel transport system substrate-binding protein